MANLKFGDVIRFEFAGSECIAMVLATEGKELVTDEDTTVFGPYSSKSAILVLGLANDDPNPDGYHDVGKTASFKTNERYEVLP